MPAHSAQLPHSGGAGAAHPAHPAHRPQKRARLQKGETKTNARVCADQPTRKSETCSTQRNLRSSAAHLTQRGLESARCRKRDREQRNTKAPVNAGSLKAQTDRRQAPAPDAQRPARERIKPQPYCRRRPTKPCCARDTLAQPAPPQECENAKSGETGDREDPGSCAGTARRGHERAARGGAARWRPEAGPWRRRAQLRPPEDVGEGAWRGDRRRSEDRPRTTQLLAHREEATTSRKPREQPPAPGRRAVIA
jgi:hypothetical protein